MWPCDGFAGDERRVDPDAEPLAEFLMVGQRAPDARDRGLELDGLFNAIGHIGNLLVAY